MEILYSDILPLNIKNDQQTILGCFHEQIKKADSLEIAVGYISKASLDELDAIVKKYNLTRVVLIIGMYFIEGMPENSYHAAITLNNKWRTEGIGEIRLVRAFKYHGKIYNFLGKGKSFSCIVGSANMGVLMPDASNRRQYEIATLIDSPSECAKITDFIENLKDGCCSANIVDITGMTLIREHNVSLTGIDTVTQLTDSDVKIYNQHKTDTTFILPIKTPKFEERFMDDKKHYTKSNINVCYAAPRNKRKSRDWYEVQMTVEKEITRLPGYPKKNVPFYVITDDGYWFKAHTTSDGNKQFSAVGDELIMGRWIKGRLAASGLVTPVNDTKTDEERLGMITQEMLNAYGCNAIVFTKTDRQFEEDGNMLDVWMLSFENIVAMGEDK